MKSCIAYGIFGNAVALIRYTTCLEKDVKKVAQFSILDTVHILHIRTNISRGGSSDRSRDAQALPTAGNPIKPFELFQGR